MFPRAGVRENGSGPVTRNVMLDNNMAKSPQRKALALTCLRIYSIYLPEQRLLFHPQHNAQEYPNHEFCIPTFFTQESGAVLYPRLGPLIHPSLRPVSLVGNENWYSIGVSLQLALLRSHTFRGVMPHVRTVQHASSTYSGPLLWPLRPCV
jgi:hypothetical protein